MDQRERFDDVADLTRERRWANLAEGALR